jgi:hypothetical protein
MDRKRFGRFSRRSLVGVIVGLAFAAAAGVGLAQITSEPSSTVSAADTSTLSTGGLTTSTSSENEFAHESSEAKDDLEFEQDDNDDQSSTTFALSTSASTQQATAAGEGAGQEKVEVCHLTGNGSSHTIDIARPAVAAHVAHGDTEGACAETTTAAATTTALAPAPTTKKPKHHVQSPTSHGNSSHTKPHGHSSHGSSSHGKSGGHGKGHTK